MNQVGIAQSTYEKIGKDIGIAIERGGCLDIRDDENVAIKINLCDFRMPDTGAVTHPVFLDAFLAYLRREFKRLKICVVESDATSARPDMIMKWLGLAPIIKKHNATWANLTKDKCSVKRINGRHLKEVKVPATIGESDYFISLSKMKTQLLTTISCSLKNQFGCIPAPRKIAFHPFLDDVIVDANMAMKPDFSIVDGIIGMGGVKGPNYGTPIRSQTVVTGKDPVSVDFTCAKIMGLRPRSIGHIRKAKESGVGDFDCKIVGPPIAAVRTSFEFSYWTAKIIKLGIIIRDQRAKSLAVTTA